MCIMLNNVEVEENGKHLTKLNDAELLIIMNDADNRSFELDLKL